jgi:hypothetical protein
MFMMKNFLQGFKELAPLSQKTQVANMLGWSLCLTLLHLILFEMEPSIKR